jgi:hypothetical protein
MKIKEFLKRHSLISGIILMFVYTWTIDLSNSGFLPFRVPFVVALTVGWGFYIRFAVYDMADSR